MFLKNVWYVCAQPEEVNRTPLARTICNERIVFWRTENGAPVAFEDRCCHRRMPLNKAACVGDRLRCHYHGLEFKPDGRCAHVPGQSTVPPGSAVRAYPVTERYKWMWIWMGDPALADVAEARLQDGSPLVRAMAVWALAQLAPGRKFERLKTAHLPLEGDGDVAQEWRATRP